MLLTIARILAAMIALAALELWLFWRLGERDERRHIRIRAKIDAADAKERRTDTRSREERQHTTGARARSHLMRRLRSRHVHLSTTSSANW